MACTRPKESGGRKRERERGNTGRCHLLRKVGIAAGETLALPLPARSATSRGGGGGACRAQGRTRPRGLLEQATTATMPRSKRHLCLQSCASAFRTRVHSWWLPCPSGPQSQHSERNTPVPCWILPMGSEGKTGRAQAVAGMISRVHIWRATTRSLSLCGAPRPWVSSFRKRARSPTADWVWVLVERGNRHGGGSGCGQGCGGARSSGALRQVQGRGSQKW